MRRLFLLSLLLIPVCPALGQAVSPASPEARAFALDILLDFDFKLPNYQLTQLPNSPREPRCFQCNENTD
ncbi:MAG TPA: hypothetical protein VI636_01995 [Candidatus Angelobacter sp.]